MSRLWVGAVGLCALAACASQPDPTEHLAASMAAVRGAETAGAEQVPQAALHLKLAQEQIVHAKQLMDNGENGRADAMTIRAYNDAELALALTREAQARRELETFAAAQPPVAPPPQPPVAPPPVAPAAPDSAQAAPIAPAPAVQPFSTTPSTVQP
jgi:hypothetical protein